MVQLGDKVKDKVTGVEGIAVARTEWLYGCIRFIVQPVGQQKDGKPYENVYVDEPQLTVVKAAAVPNTPAVQKRPHGPREGERSIKRPGD